MDDDSLNTESHSGGLFPQISNPESAVLRQLADLAAAADIHASERHGISLAHPAWEQIDKILDREREQGDHNERESLALCYGAKVGQALVTLKNAAWTGLAEPVPPRIQVNGVCYSPIDAVRRRLVDSSNASISELIRHIASPCALTDARDINFAAWETRTNDRRFASVNTNLPATREEAQAAIDPWLTGLDLPGLRLLCLAAAGGTHAPLYARAGLQVTVADFSPALLAIDESLASRHQLDVKTVRADLHDRLPFTDDQFDVVLQPVSTCYVADLSLMYAEVARVLKQGGIYLSQHKSPASLQTGQWDESAGAYRIAHPAAEGHRLHPDPKTHLPQRESEMVEHIHPLNVLLGQLCRSGFVIEKFAEPVRGDHWAAPGSAEHLATFVPPYLKVLARRPRSASR